MRLEKLVHSRMFPKLDKMLWKLWSTYEQWKNNIKNKQSKNLWGSNQKTERLLFTIEETFRRYEVSFKLWIEIMQITRGHNFFKNEVR